MENNLSICSDKDNPNCYQDNANYYPVLLGIRDARDIMDRKIDRHFGLDDLKDIQSGVMKLTDVERELLFQCLLGYYIEQGNDIAAEYIEYAIKHGISRDHLKTRA